MPYAMFNAPKEYRNLENLRVTAKIEKMVFPDSLFKKLGTQIRNNPK